VSVCALVLNLKQSAPERGDDFQIIRISVLFCTALIEAAAHSYMTGFKFRDRARREINHEHHCGRVDTKG